MGVTLLRLSNRTAETQDLATHALAVATTWTDPAPDLNVRIVPRVARHAYAQNQDLNAQLACLIWLHVRV